MLTHTYTRTHKASLSDHYIVRGVHNAGFNTTKGQLIRSILYPRPSPFSFHRDSLRFVAVMGGVGTCTHIRTRTCELMYLRT